MKESMSPEEIQQRYKLVAEKQVADLIGWTPAELRRNVGTMSDTRFYTSVNFRRMMTLAQELVAAKMVQLQVDDVLVTSWITVKDGDYRKALNDLVVWNIQLERDPALNNQPANICLGGDAVFGCDGILGATCPNCEKKNQHTPGGCHLGHYPGPVLAAIEEGTAK